MRQKERRSWRPKSTHGPDAKLFRRFTQRKVRPFFVRTDVAEEIEVRALAQTTRKHYGCIDVLFNNAAVLMYGKNTRMHELPIKLPRI
jgi:NAD(P)-dependent dehydrogenase (short-subunit alcohol dehydrogenase family)